MNKPKLRFPEYKGEWELNSFRNYFIERNEPSKLGYPLYSLTIENGIVPKSERYERSFLVNDLSEAYKVMHQNDFAFNPMNLRFGALARHKENIKVSVSKYYNIFYCNEKADSAFFEYYLTSHNLVQYYNKMATGSLSEKKRVHYLDFIKFKKHLPSLPEQKRIASFLTVLDKKIVELKQNKKLLEQYKKGIMQKLLSQELRFKDSDGKEFPKWERKKFGEITYKVGRKNKDKIQYPIYSISNKYGFITQSDQFDGLDSNKRGYDISLYKIVEKNTFAYNPARINVGSIGFSGDLDKVIVSSLYVCFKTTDIVNDYFLIHFFTSKEFNRSVLKSVEGGVREYLFYDNFSNIEIELPTYDEQTKIADFLTVIDDRIDRIEKIIELTNKYKKGLLQKMFC